MQQLQFRNTLIVKCHAKVSLVLAAETRDKKGTHQGHHPLPLPGLPQGQQTPPPHLAPLQLQTDQLSECQLSSINCKAWSVVELKDLTSSRRRQHG